MPDSIDFTGISLKTLPEIISELETAFRDTYGADINLDSNSPDGQMLNIFAQAGIDIREIISQINQSFDPEQAEGVFLDQRVAINGIERKQGSYSTVLVSITANRAMNLVGLDSQATVLTPDVPNLYIARDDAGNRFFLIDSQTIATAGTFQFLFRSAEFGPVTIAPNTITTPVWIEPGVTSINNPSGNVDIGETQETDAQLRIRRRVSTTLASIGQIDSVESAIRNLSGVTSVQVFENEKSTTSPEGIPPNSIWTIVEGGEDEDIAEAIKAKRGAGCGMVGDIEVDVPYRDGRPFIIKFDRPILQDLYIRCNVVLSGGVFDADNLKLMIANNVQWSVGQDATTDTIIAYIKSINSNFNITNMRVSDNGTIWVELVEPITVQHRFINSVSRITFL